MVKKLENKVDKNEFINQFLLKVEEGKVFLDKTGVKIKVNLDDVKIMSDGISATFGTVYIRLSTVLNELLLVDLVSNEVFIYDHKPNEVKIKIVNGMLYIEIEISQLKPISLEALLRILESLRVPYSSRYSSPNTYRLDIDISKCNGIRYDSSDGIRVVWGETWDDHELRIGKDTIVYDGLVVDISNNSYFISFEKGIMSVML